ncbi:TetR family transcriptional regulator [Ligilactobacillus acidipiscis]|uniref:TetR family transcriptional regulator n=1 Tax=Ligilactobacillus acidipiscis TaxID=89059 RepID=A0A1K1KRH3_9LACO|nr:TetR family transcriptional regulator [Ligilactobacillus acidipiscis]
MDESLDLRVQKTYTSLIQAFFDIVQKKQWINSRSMSFAKEHKLDGQLFTNTSTINTILLSLLSTLSKKRLYKTLTAQPTLSSH